MKAKLSLLFILLITALLSAQDTGRVYMFVPQMPSFQGKLDNYLAEHVQLKVLIELKRKENMQGAPKEVRIKSQDLSLVI